METVSSADGTTIAYERSGEGPTVILVGGALTNRAAQRPLAKLLAERATVINFDRRGRGDSGDNQVGVPTAPDREIEDIAALAGTVDGEVAVYGHSSGASLVIQAAARVDLGPLILHEPPYEPDDKAESFSDPVAYSADLIAILADGREADAVEHFMLSVGMPAEMLGQLREAPEWRQYTEMGRTLAYDSAAMDDAGGGRIPRDLLAGIGNRTLLLAGTETFRFMISVAEAIAGEMADARLEMIGGATHEPKPELIAPPVLDFLL